MADEFFRIEWEGVNELKQYFGDMDKKFKRICEEELTEFGLSVEEIAKALAPRDSGELEDSITASVAELKGQVFETIIGTNIEYALRRHEEPESSVTRPKYERGVKEDNFYVNGRGRETRAKPDTRGFKAGRKYLQNAMTASEDDWNTMCERILSRMVEETR